MTLLKFWSSEKIKWNSINWQKKKFWSNALFNRKFRSTENVKWNLIKWSFPVLKWILNCDSSFVFHNKLRKIVMLSWEDSFTEFLNLVCLDVLVLVSVKTNIQHWEMMMIMIYVRILVSNGFFILELFSQ